MRIRKTLADFDNGRTVSLLFSCADMGKASGKYLVGLDASDSGHLVVVFDESAAFHRDIASRYRLRPRGGGWLDLDSSKKRIRLSSCSQAYGREPDRDLTRRLLSVAFPEFSCAVDPPKNRRSQSGASCVE